VAVRTQKRIIPIPVLGIDTSRPGTLLDSRATPDCQNVRIERTQIKKKEGYTQIGSTLTGDVVQIFEFDREGTKYTVAITTSKFYWWNNAGASWDDKTGTALNGVLTQPVSATTAKISGKNVCVFCNFIDAIRKWTTSGNSADLGGSPPIAKYLLGFNRYLLLGNIKDGADLYPERVQWPDYDDPETWTQGVTHEAGYQDLDDGYEMTGLFRMGNNAICSKTDALWVGYLTNDSRIWQFDSVDQRLGFLVGNTIKVIPGGMCIGLSKFGLMIFNGIRAQLITPGIFEDIRDYTDSDKVVKSHAEVVAELNEYWLFLTLSGGTYPTRLYRYNYLTGQVYKDLVTNITASGTLTRRTATLIDDATGTIDSYTGVIDQVQQDSFYPYILLGNKDGEVFKFDYDATNEDGTAISAYWCSSDIVANPGYYSHWQAIQFEGLGDAVTVAYSTDEGATYTDLETLTLTSSIATYTVYCDIFAEKMRIKVYNDTVSQTFTMRNLYYYPPVRREAIER